MELFHFWSNSFFKKYLALTQEIWYHNFEVVKNGS
nr:MAG TPA: hypothetical protein [Caudoviricetes sp.]